MELDIIGVKYIVNVSRRGPQLFRLTLGSLSVEVVGRRLNDGGLLIQVFTRSLSNSHHGDMSIPILLGFASPSFDHLPPLHL